MTHKQNPHDHRRVELQRVMQQLQPPLADNKPVQHHPHRHPLRAPERAVQEGSQTFPASNGGRCTESVSVRSGLLQWMNESERSRPKCRSYLKTGPGRVTVSAMTDSTESQCQCSQRCFRLLHSMTDSTDFQYHWLILSSSTDSLQSVMSKDLNLTERISRCQQLFFERRKSPFWEVITSVADNALPTFLPFLHLRAVPWVCSALNGSHDDDKFWFQSTTNPNPHTQTENVQLQFRF